MHWPFLMMDRLNEPSFTCNWQPSAPFRYVFALVSSESSDTFISFKD